MNYIPLEDIIAEHETLLSTYYQSGSSESSVIYPKIARCLQEIGAKILPIKETILLCENSGVDLPADFVSLISAKLCDVRVIDTDLGTPLGQISFQKRYLHLEPCMTENSYNHDEFGRYKNIYVVEKSKVIVHEVKDLVIGTPQLGCCNPFNKSRYDIEIKNGQMLTNFTEGKIHMIYRSSLFDKGIMIPDYPEIINWLLAEMEVLILRTLLMNTTADVSQRFQLAKAELHIYKENARTFWKRNDMKDFNNLNMYFKARFKKFSR